ncbi:D-aminopeptidase [Intrasporangium oryzae NRRL B-24470]|uniref:D-aminopeptidase n=1 Tax=Intrasporangium oryzae NRRL B-24470 TaxID=1386089 RepID=W9GB02_9MICO|nr:P1 family peptidase [Intrasporangium oryzae]EWT03386.1 D-aminopeptidase [Intrasporangium oryzae NRRL B-24470]
MRARDLGIRIGDLPTGPDNAITDVDGVRVGHCTIVEGDGPLLIGRGPVRTGVTMVVPHDGNVWSEPIFAGYHRLNGNGEMTGIEWVREAGMLLSPIGITNTHSVGVVRDTLVALEVEELGADREAWALPVVGETWDGILNDVNGFHVRPDHARAAYAAASAGTVAEGAVGGGTGMICHGFKGGIGTSSRVVPADAGGFTVGVLVQANHGRRARLSVDGVPVGRLVPPEVVPTPDVPPLLQQGGGSIIGLVATDAPLLPTQCRRLAQRASFGVARTGGVGENSSGDLFLAFSTGNRGMPPCHYGDAPPLTSQVLMLSDSYVNALFDAVIEATEEAIVNALVAAQTMTGVNRVTAHALPHHLLREAMAAPVKPRS